MENGFHEISVCEVCGNERLAPVLDLGLHPMCDDLIRVGDTRICREYPLEILFCENCCTAAIEPTDAYLDAAEKGHIIFNNYFSEDIAHTIAVSRGKPDFITFTNVFAHIENLNEILSSLKHLVAPYTVIVIENHYLGAVFDGSQLDAFYHEYPQSYSDTSFVSMARSLGARLLDVEFPSCYVRNIRVLLEKTANGGRGGVVDKDNLIIRESHFLEYHECMI